ncbi:hypothetical protein [Aquitalea pelogenes]|uniref:hypothetical protein n=1 Tax=Aquitalea pelogenes TaxID=1293573 RepID=UPI00195ED60F|nr:hypothetical protein [Aquitalea pelogenes]
MFQLAQCLAGRLWRDLLRGGGLAEAASSAVRTKVVMARSSLMGMALVLLIIIMNKL